MSHSDYFAGRLKYLQTKYERSGLTPVEKEELRMLTTGRLDDVEIKSNNLEEAYKNTPEA